MGAVPGNRLEASSGDRAGQYNGQWRICFRWIDAAAYDIRNCRLPLTREHSMPSRKKKAMRGRRAITADTSLRLSRYFGTSAQFWMSLQVNYDLEMAEDTIGSEIGQAIRPHRAA